jgi:hypothetical protein
MLEASYAFLSMDCTVLCFLLLLDSRKIIKKILYIGSGNKSYKKKVSSFMRKWVS